MESPNESVIWGIFPDMRNCNFTSNIAHIFICSFLVRASVVWSVRVLIFVSSTWARDRIDLSLLLTSRLTYSTQSNVIFRALHSLTYIFIICAGFFFLILQYLGKLKSRLKILMQLWEDSLAINTLVLSKKCASHWDKRTATQKKVNHKEVTSGTSEARSSEALPFYPGLLEHLLWELTHHALRKPKSKGPFGEEPRTVNSPSRAPTCQPCQRAILEAYSPVSVGPT